MATRKAIYEHAVLTVFQEDEKKFLIKTETNFSCEPYPFTQNTNTQKGENTLPKGC